MLNLPEDLLHQGVSVDIQFGEVRPTFGDLYLICGDKHPSFPPLGAFALGSLADLQFEQVDDYFGVRSLSCEGDDVPIWLYPIAKDALVHHHSGPFDAVRMEYNILRNPVRRAAHYLLCIQRFAAFGARVFYRSRGLDLGIPPDLSKLRADIDAIVLHWRAQGIAVGSDQALELDF